MTGAASDSGRAGAPAPVILLGSSRSGTTLLRLMLNAHPDIFIPREAPVFIWALRRLRRPIREERELDAALSAGPGRFRRMFDLEQARERLAARLAAGHPVGAPEALDALFASACRVAGKPEARWGEKKPSSWQLIYKIVDWFPRAEFVHVVRHPFDVVHSFETSMAQNVHLRRIFPAHVVLAWHWALVQRRVPADVAATGKGAPLLLRYEDLVADPRAAAAELCRFLDLSPEHLGLMAEPHKQMDERHNAAPGEHHANTRKAINEESVGRGRRRLAPDQLADIAFICRERMAAYGYDAAVPDPGPTRRRFLEAACATLDLLWSAVEASRRVDGGRFYVYRRVRADRSA